MSEKSFEYIKVQPAALHTEKGGKKGLEGAERGGRHVCTCWFAESLGLTLLNS